MLGINQYQRAATSLLFLVALVLALAGLRLTDYGDPLGKLALVVGIGGVILAGIIGGAAQAQRDRDAIMFRNGPDEMP